MRFMRLTVLIAFITVAMACSGDEGPSAPDPGTPPGAATLTTPSNGAVDQSFENLVLAWDRASDAEGGTVTYDVYFGKPGDLQKLASTPDTMHAVTDELEFDTEYRWRIDAVDPQKNRTPSNESRFMVRSCHGVPGRICNWAGTGLPQWGAPGQKPEDTALYWPVDIAFSPDDTPYVVDWNNHRVLMVDASGNFQVKVGCGAPGPECEIFGDAPDGRADRIGLNHPTHVAWDPNGDLILSAWHNSVLKRVDESTGLITTFCGDGRRGFLGDGDLAADAVVDLPVNVIFDAAGDMYIADQANMRIRKIDRTTGIINTVVGSGNPPQAGYGGDGGPADQARLAFERGQAGNPSGKICFDQNEDMYIADTGNDIIRVVRKADGYIYTFAGTPDVPGYGGDGGSATGAGALLRTPRDVASDGINVYIADTGNHCIRKVDASGTITTVAGTPTQFGSDVRDGMIATSSRLTSPLGVEIGPSGNLWIADYQNNRVRIVYPAP